MKERLANRIAKIVAESRNHLLEPIRGIITEEIDQREEQALPLLLLRPSQNPESRLSTHYPYPLKQLTSPEK